MQSREEIDPILFDQFKSLLESDTISSDDLIRFNQLVTNVVDTLSAQEEINPKSLQDKDFDKMSEQILYNMFKKQLLLEPIKEFKDEYRKIIQDESDINRKGSYQKQLDVIEQVEQQVKQGEEREDSKHSGEAWRVWRFASKDS